MPGRETHLRSVARFEAFLAQISVPAQQHREWIVIVWFHIALHYVDAFLATKGHSQVGEHADRWAKMTNYDETRKIGEIFHELYKDAKEARYEGTEFAPLDLEPIQRRYDQARQAMRNALGLN